MAEKENMKLKLARIENKLTQEELAEKIEVTRQTIGLIEKGKYNPSLNLCIKIAKSLDKTLDQLFWEEN
jgi:putative transcriptional regulator